MRQMAAGGGNALAEVQATFVALDAHYGVLRAACRTDAERATLADRYAAAEANWQSCVGHVLAETDAMVAALTAELGPLNAQIEAAVSFMGDMNRVLSTLADALSVGGELLMQAGL